MEGGQNHKIQLIVGHIHPLHMGLAQMVIKAGQGNNQHSGLNTIRKTECAVGSFRLHN